MQHKISVEQMGPWGEPMAQAVQACVHCGFCLPACPTYQVLGEEMDSPRGRIFLMKEVLEGQVALDEAVTYLDRCLGCLGCVTACPSGVRYGDLITPFRATAESRRHRGPLDRLFRHFVLATLPYPTRFRRVVQLGRWFRGLRRLMPGRLREMLELVPQHLPAAEPLPEVFPAEGSRRARVALLAGCVQQVLAPDIHWATLRVLARNGVEVVIPSEQSCCGALAAHTGAAHQAKAMARQNLRAFPKDVDAILTNAAGCGSGMHEYGLWMRGEPEEQAAAELAARVKDVSLFLDSVGIEEPPPLERPLRVAFHDACHLTHAQRVNSQPRRLLERVPNLRIVEIPQGEMCCGSAGTYNVEQPRTAAELGRQKAESILTTDATLVATGNIGCMTQIEVHLRQLGRPLPVMHTIQILDRSYQGTLLRQFRA